MVVVETKPEDLRTDQGADKAIWTTNRLLVDLHDQLFDRIWNYLPHQSSPTSKMRLLFRSLRVVDSPQPWEPRSMGKRSSKRVRDWPRASLAVFSSSLQFSAQFSKESCPIVAISSCSTCIWSWRDPHHPPIGAPFLVLQGDVQININRSGIAVRVEIPREFLQGVISSENDTISSQSDYSEMTTTITVSLTNRITGHMLGVGRQVMGHASNPTSRYATECTLVR